MRFKLLLVAVCIVVGCATFIPGPVPNTLATRINIAFDANQFTSRIVVIMKEGNGIFRAEHDVEAIYVYFYFDGFAPSEWANMNLYYAMPHCEFAMRNVPNLNASQLEACAWALAEMRHRDLAPDERREEYQ